MTRWGRKLTGPFCHLPLGAACHAPQPGLVPAKVPLLAGRAWGSQGGGRGVAWVSPRLPTRPGHLNHARGRGSLSGLWGGLGLEET